MPLVRSTIAAVFFPNCTVMPKRGERNGRGAGPSGDHPWNQPPKAPGMAAGRTWGTGGLPSHCIACTLVPAGGEGQFPASDYVVCSRVVAKDKGPQVPRLVRKQNVALGGFEGCLREIERGWGLGGESQLMVAKQKNYIMKRFEGI